jgi:peptidoglycan-N-acetylglucosamine deacetylase
MRSHPTAAGSSPSPILTTGQASSPSPSPEPSPRPTPVPTTQPSPTPKASPTHKPAAASGSVSAAGLDIAGAGTLKIPMWPHQPGMTWRGPVGSQGSTGTTSVALTFDDGPGPYTSQVLDVLDEYHVKATFCMIGRQVHAYRAVVKRMIDDGMTLCDHTWDHDEALGTHPATYVARDIERMVDAVHAIDKHATVAYFRNPGGNFTPGTVRICELLGMRPLYWTEDTVDWTRPGTAAIIKTVLAKTHRDSIVLMHDGGGDRSETVTALRVLLPQLAAHYHLIALPTARVVKIDPGKPAPTPPAPDTQLAARL